MPYRLCLGSKTGIPHIFPMWQIGQLFLYLELFIGFCDTSIIEHEMEKSLLDHSSLLNQMLRSHEPKCQRQVKRRLDPFPTVRHVKRNTPGGANSTGKEHFDNGGKNVEHVQCDRQTRICS